MAKSTDDPVKALTEEQIAEFKEVCLCSVSFERGFCMPRAGCSRRNHWH